MRYTSLSLAGLALAGCATADLVPSVPAQPHCRIESQAIEGTLADVCGYVVERWVTLTGERPPDGEIRFADRAGFLGVQSDSGWILFWGQPDSGKREHAHNLGNIIPHEAGHQVFERWTPSLNPPLQVQYGSVAPDWLDEAPAIWMEGDSTRAQRLKLIDDATPSLATLITMRHPSMERGGLNTQRFAEFQVIEQMVLPPCLPCDWMPDSLRRKFRVQRIRFFPTGRTDTLVTYEDEDPAGTIPFEQEHFYPLAYSLLLFIHTRGGPDGFNELVARYAADPSPRTDVLNGLPGLPATFEEVEREWHAFLKTIR